MIQISTKLKDFINQYQSLFGNVGCFKLLSTLILSDNRTRLNTFQTLFSKSYSIEESDNGYLSIDRGKQKIRLGKVLNILISQDSYNTTPSYVLSRNIENIINAYKSFYDFDKKFKFVEYRGEKILDGYDRMNFYQNSWSDDGTMLFGSCMNNKYRLLDLYVYNEDKVSLLAVEDKDGRIHGRSLIWDLDNPYDVFMDRVYFHEDFIINAFHNYAKQNGWLYRTQKVSGYKWLKDNIEYDTKDIRMSVKLYTKGIKYYPYMDSLCYKNFNDVFSNLPPKFIPYKIIRDIHGTPMRFGIHF